jgi:hypothetical protein
MRIDFSGNLLMGTTLARSFLTFSYGTSTGNGATLVNTSTANNTTKYNTLNFVGTDTVGTGKDAGYIRSIPADANYVGSVLTFATRDADAVTERARIDSSGNLLVGTTGLSDFKFRASRSGNLGIASFTNSEASGVTYDQTQIIMVQASTSDFMFARYYTSSGAVPQFAVRGDGTVFAQNTTIQAISDARVKENVRDSSEGLSIISALRPVRFDFKEGHGNNRKNQLGFIAQEVEAVFPDAVDLAGGEDESGDPYKSVGPGALIPVLVKAIQELKAEFDAYKSTHP